MNAAQIRRRFLDYFVAQGHTEVASSTLVPADDPTLLFTNAGMVQFKRTFLGQDPRSYVRAVTCQKCVRAGGKHNDLEQVGLTRRHHTFFEMLGNFSFGDYFKRDAIKFAWEFVTSPEYLGIPADRLRVTVHHTDDEARALWLEHSTLPADRIYGLGDKDNFWQMGDTGPCGPCSEIYVDLKWTPGSTPVAMSQADFEVEAEAGRFLEIWNLVFMQFDRSADGTLTPLPKPSVDTGAGLERITAVLQGQDDNFHTDLFRPLIADVERLVGAPYPGGPEGTGISYRVLADHARAVSFLLLDGVYPSNEGRGFVLRRILRRAVRHAWLLGRREPTLVELVPTVVALMGEAYPVLVEKQAFVAETIRQEEARFLETIEAGLSRLEEIRAAGTTRIAGDEAFKLFDTFGFPLDLTVLIAEEMGISVDTAGFDVAMTEQRERSRAAAGKGQKLQAESGTFTIVGGDASLVHGRVSKFVGYTELAAETEVLSNVEAAANGILVLRESPFYATSGGQQADHGIVEGEGWRFRVTDVVKDAELGQRLLGTLEGSFAPGVVHATVDAARRAEIERNHSATHLAHMVLRRHLGGHVRQQGSLVEPTRLRFDFSHGGPVDAAQLADIEAEVNDLVLANAPVDIREMSYPDALAKGAMAFFADKYGDVVRVVTMGDSIELCGGTHVRTTGQIGLFRFTAQGGVAAGVRRIEAITGHGAYAAVRAAEGRIAALAQSLKAQPDQIERKLEAMLAEREKLEARLAEALKGGGTAEATLLSAGPVTIHLRSTVTEDRAQLGELADAFRGAEKAQAMLMLVNPTLPAAITLAVSDDLIAAGKDANAAMKLLTGAFGGRGGGRPTFASGSLGVDNVEAVVVDRIVPLVAEWIGA
ncbi:MAG: alanine--tRNA ligase [Gemmatimonadales bacterium]|nr:alanine--tRNA ligase [Gemmatimonadales bacterium]MBP6570047.1 alanine--tRNA ligase [Gemmatimonadales bacterium]MBP7620594.1 alanine--tRNA ligase [Gemmatimonadales bacterium]